MLSGIVKCKAASASREQNARLYHNEILNPITKSDRPRTSIRHALDKKVKMKGGGDAFI